MCMGTEILRMENITKIYTNGFIANKDGFLSTRARSTPWLEKMAREKPH